MSNISMIQNKMAQEGLPALLLTDELDRLYASGFHTSDGAVLILRDKAFFITDSRYIEEAGNHVKDAQVLQSTIQNSENSIIKSLLAESGITKLGAQDGSLSYSGYLSLQSALDVELVPAQNITISLREVKNAYEVDSMVAAQRIAEKALDNVLGVIKPGMSEQEVAALLEYQMAINGAQGLAFETICVSGANSSKPHGVPSGKKIEAGDFVTMDFGCKINGYCSDMTRTVAVGSVTEEMRKVYGVVLDAQLAGIAAAQPGIIGREMDKAARDIIESAGYGQYFGHGLGHSVGLYIHENPNANLREKRPLPVGTVVTSEPGIYLPGRFGVRIEDMVHITENGPVVLTLAPKELIIL